MKKQDILESINYLRKYKTENNVIEVKTAKDGFSKRCYDTTSNFYNKYGE